jgi:hypothetical protein
MNTALLAALHAFLVTEASALELPDVATIEAAGPSVVVVLILAAVDILLTATRTILRWAGRV